DVHLPVAVVQETQAAAGDLQLAFRRAVGEVVDRGERVTEVLAEADAVLRNPGKDEASIGLARYDRETILLNPGCIPLLQRDVEEGPVRTVSPCVIRAPERLPRI